MERPRCDSEALGFTFLLAKGLSKPAIKSVNHYTYKCHVPYQSTHGCVVSYQMRDGQAYRAKDEYTNQWIGKELFYPFFHPLPQFPLLRHRLLMVGAG